jgi:hypothetical protein
VNLTADNRNIAVLVVAVDAALDTIVTVGNSGNMLVLTSGFYLFYAYARMLYNMDRAVKEMTKEK